MVILKANPGILKRDGGIKMWMWLCIERESYLGFGSSLNEEDRKKYCEIKKKSQDSSIYGYGSESSRGNVCGVMVVSCLELPKGWGKERCC